MIKTFELHFTKVFEQLKNENHKDFPEVGNCYLRIQTLLLKRRDYDLDMKYQPVSESCYGFKGLDMLYQINK